MSVTSGSKDLSRGIKIGSSSVTRSTPTGAKLIVLTSAVEGSILIGFGGDRTRGATLAQNRSISRLDSAPVKLEGFKQSSMDGFVWVLKVLMMRGWKR